MRKLVFTCILAIASTALAEDNPLSAYNRTVYNGVKGIVLRSAEQVPEEDYAFKPTEEVRSFGQIVGHVADAQYIFCSAVLGEKNPAPKVEETKKSKAELIAALKDAFAYCDKAYDGLTDASAAQSVKFHGMDTPKFGVLTTNEVHTIEHYGNLVTYMRLKHIVPPTSDPAFMQELGKKVAKQ
jgi:uncharacterized damage-inducible protein DinB